MKEEQSIYINIYIHFEMFHVYQFQYQSPSISICTIYGDDKWMVMLRFSVFAMEIGSVTYDWMNSIFV